MRAADRAREILTEGLALIEQTTVDSLWWMAVQQLVRSVERDPVLSSVIGTLGEPVVPSPPSTPDPPGVNTFWSVDPSVIPPDPDEWGRWAWRSLKAVRNEDRGTVLGQSAHGERSTRPATIEGYVRPAVRWLLRELEHGASVNVAVERWIRRTEWTGPRGRAELATVQEDDFQRDLQRFLFDSGIEFSDQGREHHARRGRVDFLLRDEEAVAVELKVWRGSASLTELQGHVHQARTYPREFGIRVAYLVILAVSTENRLVLGDGLGFSGEERLDLGGVTLHVRIADLGGLAPSGDGARAVIRVGADDLDPDRAR